MKRAFDVAGLPLLTIGLLLGCEQPVSTPNPAATSSNASQLPTLTLAVSGMR